MAPITKNHPKKEKLYGKLKLTMIFYINELKLLRDIINN